MTLVVKKHKNTATANSAAVLSRAEVQSLTHQLQGPRESSSTITISVTETVRKAIELLLPEIEHSSKAPITQQLDDERNARNGWRNLTNPERIRWKDFCKILLQSKKQADQCHLTVMMPCQMHGKKLRTFVLRFFFFFFLKKQTVAKCGRATPLPIPNGVKLNGRFR